MWPARDNWRAVVRAVVGALPKPARSQESAHDADPRIMALVPEGPNRLALDAISDDAGWALTFLDAEEDGAAPRHFAAPHIILYDRELSPNHWSDIIRILARSTPRPYIILLSRNVDANLWDELQRAGGSDILRAPLDRDQLTRALAKGRQLWSARQHLGPQDAFAG